MVGSDSGEIPTVLGDAGLIFPEADPYALATHLRALLNDPALRRDLSQRGRNRVLKLFATEKVAAQHHAIYRAMWDRR